MNSRPTNVRHSLDGMGMKFYQQENASVASDTTPPSVVSPSANHLLSTPPKLTQSYSANDVTAVKSVTSTPGMASNTNPHAQQHLHNHNASLGRIPAGAMPNRHSRELSSDASMSPGRDTAGYPSISSTLQANAAPFGPVTTQPQSSVASPPALTSPVANPPYQYFNGANYANHHANGNPAGYGNLLPLMQNLTVGPNSPQAMYPPQNYTGYGVVYNHHQPQRPPQDSQARVIASRRQMDSEGKLTGAVFWSFILDLTADRHLAHSHGPVQQPALGASWWHHLPALQGPARLPLSPEAA
jgi:hypothetical protein